MSNIMEIRNQFKDAFLEKHGVKLGFMSAFVKASATALQDIPSVNASIIDNEEIWCAASRRFGTAKSATTITHARHTLPRTATTTTLTFPLLSARPKVS